MLRRIHLTRVGGFKSLQRTPPFLRLAHTPLCANFTTTLVRWAPRISTSRASSSSTPTVVRVKQRGGPVTSTALKGKAPKVVTDRAQGDRVRTNGKKQKTAKISSVSSGGMRGVKSGQIKKRSEPNTHKMQKIKYNKRVAAIAKLWRLQSKNRRSPAATKKSK